MTFYEAAVEILRSAGRPLHVKKITELSVALNLLTHVGREPEKTMNARLTQEVAKANGDSLVRLVRPGVYELREGADPVDARQTIQLRHFDDVIEDDQAAPAAETQAAIAADEERSNRNRRRRRGGRRDDESATTEPATASTEPAREAAPAPQVRPQEPRAQESRPAQARPQEARQERPNRDAQPRQQEVREAQAAPARPSRPVHERVISPAGQRLAEQRKSAKPTPSLATSAGDLGAFILEVMEKKGRPMSLAEIGEALAGSAWADIALLPIAALYTSLQRANERRANAGLPPVFKENAEGNWLPAAPNDDELSHSYAQLEAWKAQHALLLQRQLQRAIAARSDHELLGVIALVLERLGYVGLQRHDAEGDELATFSASLTAGICAERVAVRVFAPDRPITRPDISAFRGSLHLYGAPRGVVIALGGHDAATREQLDVPNVAPIDIVNDEKLASLMIQTGVGVARFQVQTPCLDDGFFA